MTQASQTEKRWIEGVQAGAFIQDLRYGIRMLLRDRGFSAVVIMSLALGIGANSAIFSVVNAVLLRPLPYREPDKIVMVWGKSLRTDSPQQPISLSDFEDLRDQNNVFEKVAGFCYQDFNLGGDDEPERIAGAFVTADFFLALGVEPSLGRYFESEDHSPDAGRVVILSHGLWQRRFGGDPGLLDKTIRLNDASFSVIGVMPAGFQSPNTADELWIPLSADGGDQLRIPTVMDSRALKNRAAGFLVGFARLRQDLTPIQAQAEAVILASRLERQYPDTNAGKSLSVVPLQEQIVGNMNHALPILLAVVGFLLLIACINVANLHLVRATLRQRELAIRTALGASRLRLLRQLLVESMIVSLVGGALGLLLALVGIKLLISINPANIPRLNEISVDARVLSFTFAISLLTGVVFGLVPAVQLSKINLNETLKEGGRGSTGGAGGNRARSFLVVSEFVLAQVLLIGAGLMIKSFWTLQKVDPGFAPESVITMQTNLPSAKYPDPQRVRSFYEEVLNRIEALPGVESAGAIIPLPLTDSLVAFRFSIEGRPPAAPNEQLRSNYRAVSPDYFRALRIPLIAGRYFTERDRERSPDVVILNQTLADRHWTNETPIGKRIIISYDRVPREIVGIVADVKHSKLDIESGGEMYVPYLQNPWNYMAIVVRTASDPFAMAASARKEILTVDGGQPVYDVKLMSQLVSDSISQPRLNTILLGSFAALATVLALIGIYGLISYSVTQRGHEIAIRMALGAQAKDIFKLIVGKGMALALIGAIIGLGAAFALTRVMSQLLYGISSSDPLTFIVASLSLSCVATAASYVPARRAAKVEPATVLRHE